jgi:hypothetical protein
VADPQIAVDVEQLMNRIQQQVDVHPDTRAILNAIQDCRHYADGISQFSMFSDDLASRTKSFVYKWLARALKSNFERQRLFNQSLVNALQLLAEELDKIQRRPAANNDCVTQARRVE